MRDHATHRWSVVVLLSLAVIPYLNAINNELVYDDRALVLENDAVRSLNPARALGSGLGRYAVEWYRPVTMYSLAVNYHFGGTTPAVYHLTNIALHAANVWLVYAVALALVHHTRAAMLAAWLFAVHPIHVEAVTPVSGRADLLATLLVLSTWRLVFDTTHAARWHRVVLASMTAFAGVLAKESAIILWPLVVLGDLARVDNATTTLTRRLRTRAALYAGLAIGLGAALAVRIIASGGITAVPLSSIRHIENPLASADAPVRLATALWVLAKYCRLLVLPIGLSADYSFNQIPLITSWRDPRLAVGMLLVIVLGAGIIGLWRRNRSAAVSIGFFLVSWLPVSNLIVPIGTVMGERLMYLPSVGLCLLIASMASRLTPEPRARPVIRTATAAASAIAIALTVSRNHDWRSQSALFASTVERSPNSAKAHFNYATALLESGRLADAQREFEGSIQIAADYPEAHNGLGVVLMRQQRLHEAETEFRSALDIQPDLASAWTNLGVTLIRLGDDTHGEDALRRAIRLNRAIPLAHASLGALAERRGDRSAAIAEYLETYRLDRQFEGLAPHLVHLLELEGRHAEAARIASEWNNRNPNGPSR